MTQQAGQAQMRITATPVVLAKARTQVVTRPEGPRIRCFASGYNLDSGLRQNDDVAWQATRQ
jgi:hypothetical protein